MRRLFINLFAVVAVAATLASCAKEIDTPSNTNPKDGFIMTVKTADMSTKTVVAADGSNYKINWESTDVIGVYEVANEEVQAKAESQGGTSLNNGGETATFTFNLQGSPTGPYKYVFVNPADALGITEINSQDEYTICLNQNQTFTADSFDPAADVLVSRVVDSNSRPTTVSANFGRVGAAARMVIKCPTTATTETIQSITFSTTEGNISGHFILDPVTGEVFNNALENNSVVLTPKTSTLYKDDVVVWFRLAPITLSNNFSVSVSTNQKTYTKTVDLGANSKTIAFENGKLTKFTVNLTTGTSTLSKGATYTLTTSSTLRWSDISTALDYEDMSWTPYVIEGADGAAVQAYEEARGAHFGSAGTGVTEMSFTGTGYETFCNSADEIGISSINVSVGAKNGVTVTGTVTVGGVSMSPSSSGSDCYTAANNAPGTISFASDNLLTGDIVIDLRLSSSGALYVKEIVINPDFRTPVTLSFAESSVAYTTANYDTFPGQDVTVSPNETAITNNLVWTYEDNDGIIADFVDGAIDLSGTTGSATVTVSFAGDENYKPANASYTLTVSEPVTIQNVTVEEFIDAEVDSDKWYRLTGVISNITSTKYGNFTLTDATGGVTVYGLTATQQASNDQSFSSLNLEEGYIVTIIAHRSSYNSNPQAGGAYYESHSIPAILTVSPTALAFNAAGESKTVTASATHFNGEVTISASSDNAQFTTSVSGTTVTVTAAANTGNSSISGTVTITATDGTDSKTAEVSVTQDAPAPAAQDGDILWQEDFTGYGTTMPSTATGAHVYCGGTVTYGLTNGGATTALNDGTQYSGGGSAPELLISKTNGSYTISGIPTGSATGMTLTFKSNHGDYCTVTSGTSGITVGTPSVSSGVVTTVITATSGVTSFDLTITNTNSSNTRVDDFMLIVGVPPVVLASISVSGQTTSFNKDDSFSFGGTVTATYSDATTADVTASASFSDYDMSTTGSQTVTVSYTEGEITKTTTYTINVSDPGSGGSSTPVTESFIFNTDNGISALGITKPNAGEGTNLDSSYTVGGVTMAVTNGSTATRVWNSNGNLDLRIYKSGGSLTFSVESGKKITSIEIAGSTTNVFSVNSGTYSSGTWTPETDVNLVVFTATGTGKINTIAVTYE